MTTPQVQTKITQWPTLIKQHRKALKLSQAAYGLLFGVSQVAVSDWESGKSEAPYIVTWTVHCVVIGKTYER